jgi:acyl-CoA thioesterase FadM
MAPLECEFVSRGYELDAEGLVSPHVFLQYLEHLRWEHASRNVSDVRSLMREDRSFVVVAQTLHLLRDIGMAVPMRGTVWIGRAGRTSLDFHHAIHHLKDKELLATGTATVVCVGGNGVSSPLPDRLRRMQQRSAWTISPEPPEFSEVPGKFFERSYRVRTADIDLLGHMNQAGYAAFYEDAHRCAIENGAYGPSGAGAGRIRSLRIRYARSAILHEEVSVGTWLAAGDPVRVGFVMRRDGALLSEAVACI